MFVLVEMPTVDIYEECTGQIGRWQILMIFLLSLLRISISWHQMGIIFLAPAPDFECSIPSIDKCSASCPSHVFHDHWETIITKWDLVCDNQYLVSLTQSVSMIGMLLGSVIIGYISDIFGRKNPLAASILLTLVTGVGTAFTPWFWLFMTLKFINGIAIGGITLNAFVLAMELIGKSYRTSVGSIFHIPFFLGYGLLGLLGYFIRNWQYLQFTISIYSIFFLCYYWIIPESPRWLLVSGKTEQAINLMQKAAKFNRMPSYGIKEKVDNYLQKKPQDDNTSSIGFFLDLVRTTNMRIRSISFFIIYFCIFFVYYGISQYLGEIGDTYINISISGFIEIPGTFICIYLMNKIGRKRTLILGNILSGIVCFLFMVVPEGINWPYTVLGSLGILFNGFAITSNYIYSGELFPTVIRSLGMGVCGTCAKIGSAIAPFLIGRKFDLPWLPPVVLGFLPLVACLFCFKLPETLNQKMPDTIEEVENKTEQKEIYVIQ